MTNPSLKEQVEAFLDDKFEFENDVLTVQQVRSLILPLIEAHEKKTTEAVEEVKRVATKKERDRIFFAIGTELKAATSLKKSKKH